MSNLKIVERFTVDAPVETVWSFLTDPVQVATCLPGAKLDGREGTDTYLGAMKIKVGPVSSEFRGRATLSEVNVGEHTLKLTGTGEDKSGGGSARLTMRCGVKPAATGGADVSVDADVELAGKLVRFGRGMIEGVSKQLFKQFVERARTRLSAASVVSVPAAAVGETAAAADPPVPTAAVSEAVAAADPPVPAAAVSEAVAVADPPVPAAAASEAVAAADQPAAPTAVPAPAPAGESFLPAQPSAPPRAADPPGPADEIAAASPVLVTPAVAPSDSQPVAVANALKPAVDPAEVKAESPPPASPAPVIAPAGITPLTTPASEESLDAGALLWQTFREWLTGWFRRIFRRPRRNGDRP